MSYSMSKRPDLSHALAPLKDFQRRTVDHAFERLFTADDRTRRFLVADEVGLGKTMVARGLIARTIEHLWETIDRLDVIYICSNADIARQNINRLHPNIGNSQDFALATRITMLPLQIQNLKKNKLNFISFTPGTSFDMGSRTGKAEERALLYCLLDRAWGLRGQAPFKVLTDQMKVSNFKWWVAQTSNKAIDESLANQFIQRIADYDITTTAEGKSTLREQFDTLCDKFRYTKHHSPEARWQRRHFIGTLRQLLADSCVDALEPDLIILDEFQRFKTLLDGSDAVGELAQALFKHPDAHTLLLSATPYKMYTLTDEQDEDSHYEDFLRTVQFLYSDDEQKKAACDYLLKAYRRALFAGDLNKLITLKQEVETLLRKVIARTEKLAASADRNALLRTVHPTPQLAASDLHSYVHLQNIADDLDARMSLNYWQSAPYLLNFMSDRNYKFKRAFNSALENAEIATHIETGQHLLLSAEMIEQYAVIDPNNARLRSLLSDTVETGSWQLLWLPPSLPYYQLGAPFSNLTPPTKRLIFSAWGVVPRAVASLVSYAAEREIMHSYRSEPRNTPEDRLHFRGRLQFATSTGRLAGMPVLALLYPSITLARLGDSLPNSAELPTLPQLRQNVAQQITTHLQQLNLPTTTTGRADERWYWAAPILLDKQFAPEMRAFWEADHLAALWQTNEDITEQSSWVDHVAEAKQVWDSAETHDLGRPPNDLADVLTTLAIAGLAIVPLRSFGRLFPTARFDLATLKHAGQIAWGFRSLFNSPEAMALLRKENESHAYWRRVLDYTAAGCLQAVLDEYCHILRESLGLFDFSAAETIATLTDKMRDVIALRTPTLGYDNLTTTSQQIIRQPHRMRTHFAVRFGDNRDDQQQLTRKEAVREAFNSPFWPFVLVSTSVGQEGLDFHHYCHAIVHWNLPSNPVDLEQREGRVHRYKNHAVRKNIAHALGGDAVFWERDSAESDIWQRLFTTAHARRQPNSSDLTPFWIYPEQGTPHVHIERHIPALPLSRDQTRFEQLRRALTAYRMAFGQNRQEDLLEYLLTRFSEVEVSQLVQQSQISLTPN